MRNHGGRPPMATDAARGAPMDYADAVLAALDPEQREVALAVRGPVCVLAGAGTGKTRAVAHRIAYAVATGVVDPAAAWSECRHGPSTRRRCASSPTSGR